MQLEFQNITIQFPPLIISGISLVIIFLLYRWSKELEVRRFTVFLYFLISTYITPLYTHFKENDSLFQLLFPLGFVIVLIYLFANKKNHPAKLKASLLGFAVAVYQLIQQYSGFTP
ncbi:hypothetical protein AC625_03490 [Peribacillus loiseleuriae]|uniref:Uncharacterized protein n=1 Tax=Peribacillus loiseleuriae TaxID=1679170 RepID=A0A0K9H0Z9_9BACI|nr:hypothetical protein [Peribacillus loiseleuriae]KMY52212.1 hypothetical protein AC625_03490 [Peribacillus loiseleuriae]